MSIGQVDVEDTLLPVERLLGAGGAALDWNPLHNLYHGPALRDAALQPKHLVVAERLEEGRVAPAGVGGEDIEKLVLVERGGVGRYLVLEYQLLDLGHVDRDLWHTLKDLKNIYIYLKDIFWNKNFIEYDHSHRKRKRSQLTGNIHSMPNYLKLPFVILCIKASVQREA